MGSPATPACRCSTQPSEKNTSEEHCFFRFVALRARREAIMKLIVAGSRAFTDYQLLCQTLAPQRHHITELIHGGARGADQLGFRWALRHHVRSRCFAADWERFGKAAGVGRNHHTGKEGELLIAFLGGRSTG